MRIKYYSALGFLFFGLTIFGCKENQKAAEQISNKNEISSLDPFAPNNGVYPPDSVYSGPFFKANYNYPTELPQGRQYPWENILQGKAMSTKNAEAYIMAVRSYIEEDMRLMIDNPKTWLDSPNRQNWYNMTWSAQAYDTTGWDGLESVYGTMTGQVLKNGIFSEYGFTGPMQNHALVYYNDVAALTLQKLWKAKDPSGFYPDYRTEAAQFEQNAIIIKAAGTTATGDDWDVLKGAGTFPIYREVQFGPQKGKGPVLQELAWIQFDIIIKDTIAAPETGWVFSTFIYDANSKGATTFDRLELLGASWGNDPGVADTTQQLAQTYLNANAPAYFKANIGYGNRLSGPIDVAVVGGEDATGKEHPVYLLNQSGGSTGGKSFHQFRASACLSCHGTSSWPSQNDFYPSPSQRLVYSDTLYNPLSKGWSNYYQNRSGVEIMPALDGEQKSTMALDYDLFMQFALNNSLLGQHLNPEHKPQQPTGYKSIALPKHPIQFKPRSK